MEIVLRFSHPVFGIQEPLLITTHDVFSPGMSNTVSVTMHPYGEVSVTMNPHSLVPKPIL